MADPLPPILHIEDDPDQRDLVRRALHRRWSYYGVESAEQAEAYITCNPVSLLILDLALPLMNGFEFLKKNRKFIRDRNVPVIVTTGLKGEGLEALAGEYGCAACYRKPYHVSTLADLIRSLFDASRGVSR